MLYALLMLAGWKLGRYAFFPLTLNRALVATFYLFVGHCPKRCIDVVDTYSPVLLVLSVIVWLSCMGAGTFYSIDNLFYVGHL